MNFLVHLKAMLFKCPKLAIPLFWNFKIPNGISTRPFNYSGIMYACLYAHNAPKLTTQNLMNDFSTSFSLPGDSAVKEYWSVQSAVTCAAALGSWWLVEYSTDCGTWRLSINLLNYTSIYIALYLFLFLCQLIWCRFNALLTIDTFSVASATHL